MGQVSRLYLNFACGFFKHFLSSKFPSMAKCHTTVVLSSIFSHSKDTTSVIQHQLSVALSLNTTKAYFLCPTIIRPSSICWSLPFLPYFITIIRSFVSKVQVPRKCQCRHDIAICIHRHRDIDYNKQTLLNKIRYKEIK